ncbi:lysine-sensitive aspartokinase 3 [candidate division KSB1 bacterium]|nr:lysine-sensitive aspartokinase 3 [candidate division KSB1 bacterium]
MIVMKFGGSSLQDASCIQRVAGLVRDKLPKQPMVVLSAMDDTTDDLKAMGAAASQKLRSQAFDSILKIILYHRRIALELGMDLETSGLDTLFKETEKHLRALTETVIQAGHMPRHILDDLYSTGEWLSIHMMTAFLKTQGVSARIVDARNVMITDSNFGNATPQLPEIRTRMEQELAKPIKRGQVPIMQGFIGSDGFGRTTTLGRGGSDFSATLSGAILRADHVEIWSDVDGILTADPTIVPEAHRIRYMTFDEAAELAYFGAKVMHPASLLPAIDSNIPIFVLNSKHPQCSGTEISNVRRQADHPTVIKSIAYKEGITVIKVSSTRMLMAHGFMASIFEIFDRFKTPVDLVSTSEVSVSITVDNTERLEEIQRELSRFSRVDILQDKAIVCLVGETLCQTQGISGRILEVLHEFTIYQISQGASEINFSFVVDESDIEAVVNRLHDQFFTGKLDSNLFDS